MNMNKSTVQSVLFPKEICILTGNGDLSKNNNSTSRTFDICVAFSYLFVLYSHHMGSQLFCSYFSKVLFTVPFPDPGD